MSAEHSSKNVHGPLPLSKVEADLNLVQIRCHALSTQCEVANGVCLSCVMNDLSNLLNFEGNRTTRKREVQTSFRLSPGSGRDVPWRGWDACRWRLPNILEVRNRLHRRARESEEVPGSSETQCKTTIHVIETVNKEGKTRAQRV